MSLAKSLQIDLAKVDVVKSTRTPGHTKPEEVRKTAKSRGQIKIVDDPGEIILLDDEDDEDEVKGQGQGHSEEEEVNVERIRNRLNGEWEGEVSF